jgi:hypothetical protein
MSVANIPIASAHASLMIPGERESGPLTRFAVSPEVVHSMVDVTMDAATIADRRREGGGAARERRPARVPPWTVLMQRVAAMWRLREHRRGGRLFNSPAGPRGL